MRRKDLAGRLGCFAVSAVLLTPLMGGCSKEVKQNTTNAVQSSPQASTTGYPIVEKPITLTMWATLRKAVSIMTDFNQKACFEEMEKATGIHIEWKHPPAGQEKDQFNLMVASNDLPDLIWTSYFKSPSYAVSNKLVVPLNDYLDKYAPNYKKVMEKFPNFKKAMYTDEEVLPGFGFAVPYLEQNIIDGPMIRKDWLDRLGLKIPETIDDWETVLTAFRDKDPNGNGKPDEIPFDSSKNVSILKFAFAWGVKADFYIEGNFQSGKVKYGPLEPAFRDYITKMNDWYKKGLINKDYLVTDSKLFEANVTGNKTGSTIGAAGGYLENFNRLMEKDPNFLLWPAPLPKLTPTSKQHADMVRLWSQSADARGYITAGNKHIVESVRWFDWGYTPEGEMAFNLGKEGVSYKKENGALVLTEEMIKNTSSKYTMSGDEHAFVLRPDLVKTSASPALVQTKKSWGNGFAENPELNLSLPPISLSDEEMSSDSGRLNDIKTYVSEMIDKFITGKEPIQNYDSFVKQLKNMGIEESVKIRQKAVERWAKRGGIPVAAKVDSYPMNARNVNFTTQKGIDLLDDQLK